MMWVTTIIVEVCKELGEVSKGPCKKTGLFSLGAWDQSLRLQLLQSSDGPRELQDTVGSVVKNSHA